MLTILNAEASYFVIISKIIGSKRKPENTLSVLMKSCTYLHNMDTKDFFFKYENKVTENKLY